MNRVCWVATVVLGTSALGLVLYVLNLGTANRSAVVMIAEEVASYISDGGELRPGVIDQIIDRLIEHGAIHGRSGGGKEFPANVIGKRFQVVISDARVICRTEGVLGLGNAEAASPIEVK